MLLLVSLELLKINL